MNGVSNQASGFRDVWWVTQDVISTVTTQISNESMYLTHILYIPLHFRTSYNIDSIETVIKCIKKNGIPFFPPAGQIVVQPSFFQARSFLSSTLPGVFLL